MRTVYDTNPMDWREFHSIVNLVSMKVQDYSQKNNLHFDLIIPILRSGGVPSVILAHSLGIQPFLPVQFGHIKDK